MRRAGVAYALDELAFYAQRECPDNAQSERSLCARFEYN
jgi:hypothetical protein